MTFRQTLIATAVMFSTLIFAAACSTKNASENSPSPTSQAAAEVGATHYAVVTFAPGQDSLSESERNKLRELAGTAEQHGKIQEIAVLAWADREYPVEGQKVTSKDSDLADNRAVTIKEFLKDDVKTPADIESHNMAKRPGTLSEMVKTDDYKVKAIFEATGAAPNDIGSRTAALGNKASKALVLVKYE